MRCQDFVSVDLPNVLRDRLLEHRLHPRMAMHKVVEEALSVWESQGGWSSHLRVPVDGFEWPPRRGPRQAG